MDLDRLAEWWKKEKKPGLLEPVSLKEFLGERRNSKDNSLLNSYPTLGVWNCPSVVDFVSNLVRPPP